MSLRNRARRLQRATGMTYQQALAQLKREALAHPLKGPEEWRAIAGELSAARRGPAGPIQVVELRADPIQAACARLCESCAARAVLLLDRDHRRIAQAGAASGVWPLLAMRRQRNASGPIEVGDGTSVISRRLARGELLIVLFDHTTSYGLVLLRLVGAVDELERLLAARVPGFTPPPPRGGGDGSPPVQAWESVEIFALADPSPRKKK